MNQQDVTYSATSFNKEFTMCSISDNSVVYPSCYRTEISATESKGRRQNLITLLGGGRMKRERVREIYKGRESYNNKASKGVEMETQRKFTSLPPFQQYLDHRFITSKMEAVSTSETLVSF